MTQLQTSFGSIRYYQNSDAESLAHYANNREVWINLRDGFPLPYTLENGRGYIDTVSRQNPHTSFAIASESEVIGGIGISINEDVHRLTAELGYWLGKPFWGKGIMTEAVKTFTDFCFVQYNLLRIYAEPYAYNPASCRVLEKAGFSLEGRMRCSVIKDGKITDQLLYAKIYNQSS
ncbi:MAG: GNAT family protein [Anaerolineaceae bacterium]|nr:GNAT family protein [Anaerolineaceae bacterium]